MAVIPKHTLRAPRRPTSSTLGGRILWGRIAILAGLIFVAFLFGMLIGQSGGDGISKAQYESALDDVTDSKQQITALEGQLKLANEKAQQLEAAQPQVQPQNGDSSAEGDEGADTAEPDTKNPTTEQTYTTQKNDSWWAISEKFYGDGAMFTVITQANGMTKDTPVVVGMQLKIPPKPGTTPSTTAPASTTTAPKKKAASSD